MGESDSTKEPEDTPDKRLRRLLALEMIRIVEDVELRADFMVGVWGRHRAREPLLDAIYSRWRTVGWTELVQLETEEFVQVQGFYRELARLRLYFQFTEDMPTTFEDKLARSLARLSKFGHRAIDALGGLPERPELDLMSPLD